MKTDIHEAVTQEVRRRTTKRCGELILTLAPPGRKRAARMVLAEIERAGANGLTINQLAERTGMDRVAVLATAANLTRTGGVVPLAGRPKRYAVYRAAPRTQETAGDRSTRVAPAPYHRGSVWGAGI